MRKTSSTSHIPYNAQAAAANGLATTNNNNEDYQSIMASRFLGHSVRRVGTSWGWTTTLGSSSMTVSTTVIRPTTVRSLASRSKTIKKKQQPPQAVRFPSALRKLASQGVDALRPTYVMKSETDPYQNSRGTNSTSLEEGVWRPPAISRRIANVLRKQAITEGTYGSFNVETLRGWDPKWDLLLATFQYKHEMAGAGRVRMTPPKKASHHRSRERRAKTIEQKMQDMDQRIETYHQERHNAKPPDTFENRYKKVMRVKR